MNDSTNPAFNFQSKENQIEIAGTFTISDLPDLFGLTEPKTGSKIKIVIKKSSSIDQPTLVALKDILSKRKNAESYSLSLESNQTEEIRKTTQVNRTNKNDIDLLHELGKSASEAWTEITSTTKFIRETFCELYAAVLNPSRFRIKEIASQIDQTGFFAIGIVALVTFLIGIVIAYLMGNQLQYYGANIFVVDGVAVAMCRELSPILTAIVVAGRSGSAFAAQIGSMKLNQEIDALEVIGLKPLQVLIIPRILGLMISLPFLVLIGDVFGILGGMFISNIHLDISYENFLERLNIVLQPRQVLVGLSKAPIFALFIAAIGCRLGLDAKPNAVSIGVNTTRTVVQSIVSVILLNAAAAIIFTQLKI